MPPPFREDQWEDLLDFIEQGKVIPIIGEGAVTYGEEDRLLYPWLAEELARRLEIPAKDLPPGFNISAVVQAHLLRQGERNAIYSRLYRILKDPAIQPGPTLRQLADVEALRLFLSTTFDPLLERALHPGGNGHGPTSVAFFPGASQKDIPARMAELDQRTVYHLLGRVSIAAGEFVAWEDDLLDFLSELPRHLHVSTDVMRNLSADLRSQAILAVGLSFSDWIARLLLRIARQESLSRVSLHSWVAGGLTHGPPASGAGPADPASQKNSMVLFFGGVNRCIQVVECYPPAFVSELSRRWRARYPKQAAPAGARPAASATSAGAQRGLVFLSYAREDEAAAREIKARIETAGCTVYFDRERLGGGMNFHYELEDQVSRYCAVFISVVSAVTESAVGDNYFRRERFWASERAKSFSDREREEFYLPFIIHANPASPLVHEPRIFSGCQWIRCAGGVVPEAAAQRVHTLQEKFRTRTP